MGKENESYYIFKYFPRRKFYFVSLFTVAMILFNLLIGPDSFLIAIILGYFACLSYMIDFTGRGGRDE